ncbi:hypothetical protein [Adhaeribacter radiodurans]|uniref:Uncharacterized protein n=1 Tax=Adhaeribacter radiodurans TaxID=2745197 RepID=A0A7L7LE02_9BACT|nr:hypothetical protein [Adhaeribacter radiodurans]QMU31031.1 hypothetical protein HUW48_24730 [Adhaeribacter radiodurans]
MTFTFLCITLTHPVKLFAQEKIRDKTIGGNQFDALYSVQQTSDGGYMLGGTSRSGKSGDKIEANQDTPTTC